MPDNVESLKIKKAINPKFGKVELHFFMKCTSTWWVRYLHTKFLLIRLVVLDLCSGQQNTNGRTYEWINRHTDGQSGEFIMLSLRGA